MVTFNGYISNAVHITQIYMDVEFALQKEFSENAKC